MATGESFDNSESVSGRKALPVLTWGCLGFLLIMAFGTYAVGSFFGSRLKLKADAEARAADAKASQSAAQARQGSGPAIGAQAP